MGMTQASEQAFLSIIQSSRIIKMVNFFTQKGEALHQNGTRLAAVENYHPQNGDFLFSVENSGSQIIYLPDLQTKAVLCPKTRTGQKQK